MRYLHICIEWFCPSCAIGFSCMTHGRYSSAELINFNRQVTNVVFMWFFLFASIIMNILIYIFFVLHKSEPARVLTDPFHVGCHLGYIDMADDTPGAKGEEFGRFPSIFSCLFWNNPIYIYILSVVFQYHVYIYITFLMLAPLYFYEWHMRGGGTSVGTPPLPPPDEPPPSILDTKGTFQALPTGVKEMKSQHLCSIIVCVLWLRWFQFVDSWLLPPF